jgi:hypothetical protein
MHMPDIVDFLEKVGQDALLNRASRSELELVLAGVKMDQRVREALVAGDRRKLQALFDVAPLCAMLIPGEEQEEEQEDEDTEESPEHEESMRRSVVSVVEPLG